MNKSFLCSRISSSVRREFTPCPCTKEFVKAILIHQNSIATEKVDQSSANMVISRCILGNAGVAIPTYPESVRLV